MSENRRGKIFWTHTV